MLSSFPSTIFLSNVVCTKCGTIDLPVLTPGTGPHAYKGSCANSACGTFIMWISGKTPEEKFANRAAARHAAMGLKDPTAAQLAFLRALGDTAPAPATMAEASARISALRAGKAVER